MSRAKSCNRIVSTRSCNRVTYPQLHQSSTAFCTSVFDVPDIKCYYIRGPFEIKAPLSSAQHNRPRPDSRLHEGSACTVVTGCDRSSSSHRQASSPLTPVPIGTVAQDSAWTRAESLHKVPGELVQPMLMPELLQLHWCCNSSTWTSQIKASLGMSTEASMIEV